METLGAKIGLLAIAVFLGYVILKLVAAFLVDMTIWSNTDARELSDDPTDAQEPSDDPVEDIPGLHVLSEVPEQPGFLEKKPTEESIRTTIRGLDWVGGFHQVLLVTSPGVSLEVSGSVDPGDGLSSVYRDNKNKIYRVAREPPASVENMEDLLVSFHLGDGRWEQMYDYSAGSLVDDDTQELYHLAHYLVYYFEPNLTDDERSLLWACHKTPIVRKRPELEEQRKFRVSEEARKTIAKYGLEQTIRTTSDAILNREGDNIFMNRCPKCERLVKTPKAKLCLWCGHSWKDTEA